MSFMFNPFPYEDPTPVNRPAIPMEAVRAIVSGTRQAALHLAKTARALPGGRAVIVLDGYPTAQWERLVNLVCQELVQNGAAAEAMDVSSCYKDAAALDAGFRDLLPTDKVQDPILLYGKLLRGGYGRIFDAGRLADLARDIERRKAGAGGPAVLLVYGCGSAVKPLRKSADLVVYLDVTPKQAVLRARGGLYRNLGDAGPRPIREMLRRCYYIDFEAAAELRKELLDEGAMDFYGAADDPAGLKLLPRESLEAVFSAMVKTPFRCKPVYLEGVWGGSYIRRLRNLPKEMRNCAWVFDLIPLEVSLLVEAGEHMLEFPFFTFVQKAGEALMGRQSVKRFGCYFPIRFNYDDTFHSSGNMSIQVHPGERYVRENNGEHGRQDESYYVVATGHGARTYLGFHDGADPDGFLAAAKKAEKDGTPVDHDRYVHAFPSQPGAQFLIPAGTIHASGRNQLILEIGSLTVGSYTYKLYDYQRRDLDGTLRPIHTWHGERVLAKDRKASWVGKNLVQEPRRVRGGDGWTESIVGEHDLLYFSLRRLEFEAVYEGDTEGRFHVLNLVDGERVVVESVSDPRLSYTQNYLDMVVVPASVGRYRIRNLGNQPVVVHKTMLKDGFDAV